ncbi:GroES-like protein [Obba rivulosa]|uniref:GroES-like protein n=1 Tax=Obba rivulosa TaxID=1052685 RepID=A0A8E2AXX3_9APHY|nr:GroES-like protein [Obba rivulosa]
MPAQQKALLLKSKKGQFVIEDISVYKPGAGQLLIRIESAGLNPADWKIAEYGVLREEYPAILGYDAAGVVEEVGEGVQGFAKGDRVLFQAGRDNSASAFQQYALAEVHLTAKLPSKVTFDQAASIPCGLNTAALGLFTHNITLDGADLYPPWREGGRGKYAGKPIMIFGGSSCVGLTIQVAKLSGFSPIITTASPRNVDMLKALGATHVLDRNLSSNALPKEIAKITSQPLEIVYDAISIPSTQNAAYDVTAPDGFLVLVLSEAIDASMKASHPGKNVIVHIGASGRGYEKGDRIWRTLTELLEEGAIKPMRVEVLPGGLAGVLKGLELLKNEQVSAAKLVVHPQETA